MSHQLHTTLAAAAAACSAAQMPAAGVVLLLGAPGVGKSLLGRALYNAHSQQIQAFLNVGQHLRTMGKLDYSLLYSWPLQPTAAASLQAELKLLARQALQRACSGLKQSLEAGAR